MIKLITESLINVLNQRKLIKNMVYAESNMNENIIKCEEALPIRFLNISKI